MHLDNQKSQNPTLGVLLYAFAVMHLVGISLMTIENRSPILFLISSTVMTIIGLVYRHSFMKAQANNERRSSTIDGLLFEIDRVLRLVDNTRDEDLNNAFARNLKHSTIIGLIMRVRDGQMDVETLINSKIDAELISAVLGEHFGLRFGLKGIYLEGLAPSMRILARRYRTKEGLATVPTYSH